MANGEENTSGVEITSISEGLRIPVVVKNEPNEPVVEPLPEAVA